MAPVDWSWGERYESPTLVHPFPAPMLTHPTTFPSNPIEHGHLPTIPPTHAQALQWTFGTKAQLQPQPVRRPSLLTATSRKRSRDQMSEMDDGPAADSSRSSPIRRTPSPPKQEPIYGPGMTFIYPGEPGYTGDASTQTGTWAEELSERLKNSSVGERPVLESRKSMRLDACAPGLDDVVKSVLPADVRVGAALVAHPVIDEATHTLGISWTTIPCTPTMDAASRGWARYLENHFPLQSVRVVWQNKTIPAYLVSAITREPISGSHGSPGYYLFDEALEQGRLVAKSWETALDCLRASPMMFEGTETLVRDGLRPSQQMVIGEAANGGIGQSSGGMSGGVQHMVAITEGGGEGMDIDM